MNPPILGLPGFTTPFIMKCDASGIVVGAVLMHRGQRLAFFNQALEGRTQLLSIYENELFCTGCNNAKVEALPFESLLC